MPSGERSSLCETNCLPVHQESNRHTSKEPQLSKKLQQVKGRKPCLGLLRLHTLHAQCRAVTQPRASEKVKSSPDSSRSRRE